MKYRHTKIVFTIGPATAQEEVLSQLLREGVDICRLNMAHATHDWCRETIKMVRETCDKVGRQVAFMMDVKGPEIRTRDIPEVWQLEKGELIDLSIIKEAPTESDDGKARQVAVNYRDFLNDINVGDTILIDSGLIRMEVVDINDTRARCKVLTPGPLGNRRHINLPGVHVNLPALTEKDKEDIKCGIELGVEFFALSFVRTPDDLDILRRYLSQNKSLARIVAKIEDQSAISNLEDIVSACDVLMIARGDLGIEIPYETLPIVQRRAAEACLRKGKPFICATHLLESMIENAMPTRAEITDISNAVFEQADCIMLSGETTVGKYPAECVDVFNRVCRSIESTFEEGHNKTVKLRTPKAKMLRSAVVLAEELGGAGILVFTRSGFLARVLASLRPVGCPVYAFTDVDLVFKQSLILWGIEPFLMDFSDDPETSIQDAFARLKEGKFAQEGDPMVVVTIAHAGDRILDIVQYRRVE